MSNSNDNKVPERKEPIPVELGDGVVMWFEHIPAGEFYMGSHYSRLTPTLRDSWDLNAEPRHQVRLSEFYLGRFPVKQAEFAAWPQAEEIGHKNGFDGEGYEQHPAENMSWDDALNYCAWLNDSILADLFKQKKLPSKLIAILPTEAQWEHACRGGSTTEYFNGDGEAALLEAGWYDEGRARSSTEAVGQLLANNFNLHDMHGNVWEWCLDAWDDAAYKARIAGVCNPLVLNSDDSELEQRLGSALLERYSVQRSNDADRVVRGGSWVSSARWCRSACRVRWSPDDRLGYRGFRVCLVPDPAAAETDSKQRSP